MSIVAFICPYKGVPTLRMHACISHATQPYINHPLRCRETLRLYRMHTCLLISAAQKTDELYFARVSIIYGQELRKKVTTSVQYQLRSLANLNSTGVAEPTPTITITNTIITSNIRPDTTSIQ